MEELLENQMKMSEIMKHPLFIAPPASVKDSYNFGWMRGIAFMTDTMLGGKWYSWLLANAKGETDVADIPKTKINVHLASGSIGHKMLEQCMTILSRKGYRITDFIEWIGYALGIAWFEKPRIPDDVWEELYKNFNLDIFYMEPADYLSTFVAEHGQSGHLDYFPTPMHVTTLINSMLTADGEDRTYSQFEPCIGGAAMILPSESLNLVGADLSLTMAKVSSIQAFIYKPWMLYVPKPIIGVHADKETLTINRYFEFNTDTRVYCGDSILGEYQAPVHIFEENSEIVDIYCHPVDLTKRDVFKYEEDMLQEWDNIPHERKLEIVKAQSREIGWQILTTNPPFNVKLGRPQKERILVLNKSNEEFLKERAIRLEKLQRSHALVEAVIKEVEYAIAEHTTKEVVKGQLQLVL